MIHQIKTNKNVRFDEPLSEQINLKVTVAEKTQLEIISRQNYISAAELLRNLIRENLHKYAMSEELKKNLHISNEIDRLLLEFRVISSRKETNLSKIREILTDFEAFCEVSSKYIDTVAYKSRMSAVRYVMKLVYEEDPFLSAQIDAQYRRLLKSKVVKRLGYDFENS